MSIFKTSWVILKAENSINKDFIYTIFSVDYWKIKAVKKISKKEKTLDLWYVINFEVEVKKDISIHKIKSIKIKSEFLDKNKTFNTLYNYLILLANIEKSMAFWMVNKDIFNLVKIINIYEKIDEDKLILASLKVKHLLWELAIINDNIYVLKILKFVQNNPINIILKLKNIDENIKRILEKII